MHCTLESLKFDFDMFVLGDHLDFVLCVYAACAGIAQASAVQADAIAGWLCKNSFASTEAKHSVGHQGGQRGYASRLYVIVLVCTREASLLPPGLGQGVPGNEALVITDT